MRRQGLFRLHRDQEGATAIIVALCLISLFGMLVLVVDVGGLLWKRREMVSGADAAALAAAKTCAVPAVTDPTNPQTQANTAAINNVGGLTSSNMSGWTTSGCSTVARTPRGYVTVQYSYPQQLFFAGIFGASSRTVVTEATAAWGPLASGNAVPIVLESSQFQGPCEVPDIAPPATCPFWYDNGSAAIGDANWGFLSLDPDQWGVSPTDNNVCSNIGASTRQDWILHNSPTELPLEDPGPTYVCTVTGHASSNWQDLVDRYTCPAGSTYSDGKVCPGDILLMPVNDCGAQVNSTGGIVLCGTGTPDKYAIIGFTTLQLTAVYKGNDPAAIGSPGTNPMYGTCNGAPLALSSGGTRQLNALATTSCGAPAVIDSVAFDAARSTDPSAASSVTFKTYYKTGNGAQAVRTYYKGCLAGGPIAGCDYTYNPATFTLQWVNATTQSDGKTKLIDAQWTVNGTPSTPGACGVRSSDPNAVCLVTTWLGYTDLNGTVGTGPSFGPQGHVLCDFTYNSCPAGIKP